MPSGVEPYLVLELLKGRPLIDLLRAAGHQKRRVPLGVAIRVIADAARGLEHAHRLAGEDGHPLGLVHRDVTPHNLFVCSNGVVKLLDFGIAKARAQHHQTRAGTIKGKFAYLAPEQIRGLAPDARLDVFSLGIVMYELLIGRPLFRGRNDAETMHRILSYEIPPPEKFRDNIPNGLGAVALRALQRDRDRRLPSAAAFADAIEAVATAASIDATAAEVRAFTTKLFPDDAREHAEDAALARRTYEHLSSSSLRAIGSSPWITPPGGSSVADRPMGVLTKLAVGLCAVCITATAAVGTSNWLRTRTHATHATNLVEPATSAAVQAEHPIDKVSPTAATSGELIAPKAPIVAAQRASRPAAMPAPAPDVDLPAHKRPHAVAVASGRLRIAAHPWAEVLVDGHVIGTTPLKPTDLPEGKHQIVLRNRDLGVTVKRHVVVYANKEAVLVVDLFAEQTHGH